MLEEVNLIQFLAEDQIEMLLSPPINGGAAAMFLHGRQASLAWGNRPAELGAVYGYVHGC